jgi:hypothetical protein
VASLIAGAHEPAASSRSRSSSSTTTTSRGVGSGGGGGGECVAAAAASHQRVLQLVFVNRTQTKRSRGLANLDELLGRCRGGLLSQHRVAFHRTSPLSPRGLRLCCSAHAFGGGSLAQDIRVARGADMLVGTHGAGLNNAFFMRPGSALVEVRPYGFEGSWPDQYFKAQLAIEDAVHFYQISTGSTSLMHPPPPANATGWVARNGRSTELPWRTLREVLSAILRVNGSTQRYTQLRDARAVKWVSGARRASSGGGVT